MQHCERETYRVVVPRENGTEVLLTTSDARFVLPSIQIPRRQRVAANLTAAMKNEWGFHVVCSFMPQVVRPLEHSNQICYQVMECCDRAEEHGARAQWISMSSLSQHSFADPVDYTAVQQALAEYDAYARGAAPGPFARPGWFRQLRAWVEEVIEPLGLKLEANFSQLNASPSFSLIRFETDGPAVWFKAVGEPNLREFPITLALAALSRKYVPALLATRLEWNGWLVEEIGGRSLEEAQDIECWKSAATALSRLQIDLIGKNTQLLNAGARDLRVSALCKVLEPFLHVMAQLMAEQVRVPPVVLARGEVLQLGEQIRDALSMVGKLGLPETLGHLDLNPGNVVVSPDACVFLDWAEAYVGNPFFSFEYLLEHFRRTGADPALEAQLSAAYAEPWQGLLPADDFETASFVAPLLAVFAYAAGSEMWSGQEKLRHSNTAGILRSLTRRMKQEADRLLDRRARCLS